MCASPHCLQLRAKSISRGQHRNPQPSSPAKGGWVSRVVQNSWRWEVGKNSGTICGATFKSHTSRGLASKLSLWALQQDNPGFKFQFQHSLCNLGQIIHPLSISSPGRGVERTYKPTEVPQSTVQGQSIQDKKRVSPGLSLQTLTHSLIHFTNIHGARTVCPAALQALGRPLERARPKVPLLVVLLLWGRGGQIMNK